MKRSQKQVFLFLLPALLLVAFFVVYPIVYSVILSFIDKSTGTFTFDNYIRILTDTNPLKALITRNWGPTPPWGALVHNVIWVAIHVPVTVFGSLLIAYLLKYYVKGGTLIKTVLYVGMVIPPAVGGLIAMFMFYERVGVFPIIFSWLGIEPLSKTWVLYKETALWALILGSIWVWMGFGVVVVSAGLESIPRSHIEAAKVFGASSWKTFWRVVVPQLKPVVTVVVVMTALWDMKIFDFVWASSKGGPLGASNVLAIIMYDYFIRDLDYNASSAVAVLLTLFISPIMYVAIKRMRE